MLRFFRSRRRTLAVLVGALALGAVLNLTNTNPARSQTQFVSAFESPDDPGLDPDSEVWDKVSGITVPLSAQAAAYAAGGSVETVRIRAIHHDGRLYVRVAWQDSSLDDATTRVEDFSDAVALEFPTNGATSVPSICMGQADGAVNIWHWRADSNAGLRDPADVYASSSVDGYPFKDSLFYTAREAGNPFARPELGAVQTLSSRAFGQLSALSKQDVDGFGKHSEGEWAVVFVRDFVSGAPGHAEFAASTKTDMAVAVWDGSKDERNGRKAVSQIITLDIASAAAFEGDDNRTAIFVTAALLLLGVSAIGGGLALYGYREGRS